MAKKTLSAMEAKEILALKKEDVTMDFLKSLFTADLEHRTVKYNTFDEMMVPADAIAPNVPDAPIKTTIGRYLVNLVVIPRSYQRKYGYVNEPLTGKAIEKMESKMGTMILNDEMSTLEFADYLDSGEWMGIGSAYFIGPSMNYEIYKPIPEVIALRDKLFEKYKKEIEAGDPNVASKIEGECLALAEKKIKESGNESYDFFSTGIASISNHYKKSSVMAGAIQNPHTKKIEILKGNYMDGVSPDEYNKLSMLTIIGGYSRGVETELGGVERKKLANAMQGVKINDGLDDCGTDLTIRVTLEEGVSSLFLYRYIVDNGKLVQLTDKNIKDYIGKEVLLRSPLCCKAEGGYCRKCCGDFFSKLGVSNVGLFNNDMAGTLMNASMKAFHDSTLKFTRINIKDYIRKR